MRDPDNPCPYCGRKSVDITTAEQATKRFLCIGPDSHEWTEEHMAVELEDEPLIILP
jgi:endogenous inhibitor of DNA gyrase (YacG/DUF329 family)